MLLARTASTGWIIRRRKNTSARSLKITATSKVSKAIRDSSRIKVSSSSNRDRIKTVTSRVEDNVRKIQTRIKIKISKVVESASRIQTGTSKAEVRIKIRIQTGIDREDHPAEEIHHRRISKIFRF